VLGAWRTITRAADPWLDTLTPDLLEQCATRNGKPIDWRFGNMLQRVIYHYWYHNGENLAIRQMLGQSKLPQFIGSIDTRAPYRREQGERENPQ